METTGGCAAVKCALRRPGRPIAWGCAIAWITASITGRCFCPTCGSPALEISGDEVELNPGALDASDRFVPGYELRTARRESRLPPFDPAHRYARDRPE